MVFLPDAFTTVSSAMTVHSEPCKKVDAETCVQGSEQGERPRAQGMQVKQTSLLWSFKLESLKHQLAGNGKIQ